MRFTRGFLAGLGAATSLVLAGSLALLALSTVVAFKGWPELRAAKPSSEAATLAVAVAPSTTSTQPVRLASPPARSGRPARTATPRQQPEAVGTVPSTTSSPATYQRPDVRTREAAAVTPTGPPSGDGDEPGAVDDVRETTKPLADGVRKVTDGLGDAVEPSSPTLNQTIDDLGETVGTAVEGLGDVVGTALDGLVGRGVRAP